MQRWYALALLAVAVTACVWVEMAVTQTHVPLPSRMLTQQPAQPFDDPCASALYLVLGMSNGVFVYSKLREWSREAQHTEIGIVF